MILVLGNKRCIFWQFLDWNPEFYEKDELPKEMPAALRQAISNHTGSQQVIQVFI